MYMKSRLIFSLVKVSISTMSLSSVNVHRLPGLTFSRQARQKGHDLDFLLQYESELQLL
jgi:hypothetical protein